MVSLARLNRGTTCNLELASAYAIYPPGAKGPRYEPFPPVAKTPEWVEVTAQLLMQSAGIAPLIPGSLIDSFPSMGRLQRAWCSQPSVRASGRSH